jgi:hypothetical protein
LGHSGNHDETLPRSHASLKRADSSNLPLVALTN